MKIYTYSQVREKLADILEESKKRKLLFVAAKAICFLLCRKHPLVVLPLMCQTWAKGLPEKKY